MEDQPAIAIVLAAGLSRRMRQFKLTLPWGERTVIQRVVDTITKAGLRDVLVVLGHRADEVRDALGDHSVRFAVNPRFADGEMLGSIQAGLAAIPEFRPAALLFLGDQPQVLPETVQAVLEEGARRGWSNVIIPSYNMRGGHPILLPRWIWQDVLDETAGSLREVLSHHRNLVRYLVVDTPTILADLDTPEDYAREQPDPGQN